MFDKIKKLFSSAASDEELQHKLDAIRQKTPVPVFWLYGKTQSGKTSLIKFLTGADEAEIGQGFKPCTRFSRQYRFPTPEAPLMTFLDTRGVDEPGYDPREDLAQFDLQAHVIVITAKVMDHALENLLNHFRPIRQARPSRPVVLALTCLHEAYPQLQHPQPYPFVDADLDKAAQAMAPELRICLAEQRHRFQGLVDAIVPIDLTQQIDGYEDTKYGGARLRDVLLDALPAAYRQTMLTLDRATKELQDLYAQRALPHILGYSSMAATAGAIPIPWVDLLILP
ncbi:MAG TPA: GTPase, partial [Gemmataceae bacterium]|nr:GTPase [Gemmataceae bacterium]